MRRSIHLHDKHVEWLTKKMDFTGASLAGVIRNLIEKEIRKDEILDNSDSTSDSKLR